jgi:hypothetical protein
MKIRRIMTPEHPTDPNDEGSFEKELEENIKWFRGEGVDVSDVDTAPLDVYNVEADKIKAKI